MRTEKESRVLQMVFTRGGSGSISTKLSIPKKWIDLMGINEKDRKVIVDFDGNKITIQKLDEEG